jgi:anti-anti-sigma regulatory factor
MPVANNTPDGFLKLEGALHISTADELRKALANGLAEAPELVLDLSGVEACDTASFQLLCAARRSAALMNKTVRLTAISNVMVEAGVALGLPIEEITAGSTPEGTDGTEPKKRGEHGAE